MARQCVARRILDREQLCRETGAWQAKRNRESASVDRRFKTEDARIKLKSLYPSIQWPRSTSAARVQLRKPREAQHHPGENRQICALTHSHSPSLAHSPQSPRKIRIRHACHTLCNQNPKRISPYTRLEIRFDDTV